MTRPRARFALGIDAPLYLSVHSAMTRLAPAEMATVQVAKYLPAGGETDPHEDERELEALLDIVQPGWREVVVTRRYLPRLVVTNAPVTAAMGGCAASHRAP